MRTGILVEPSVIGTGPTLSFPLSNRHEVF